MLITFYFLKFSPGWSIPPDTFGASSRLNDNTKIENKNDITK
jgi:hypothetical protein